MFPQRKAAGRLALAAALGLGCSRGGVDVPTEGDGRPASDLPAPADLRAAADLRRPPSAEVSFGPAATYAASQLAYHFAVGRIDLDDRDDLLVSGRPGATAYLSRGDGTLTVKPQGLAGNWQIALADMDRDGKGDMLLPDTGGVMISLGNGDGTFRAPIAVPAGASPAGVAAAELSGDGVPDLLAVHQMSGQLLVFLGKGDGTMTAGQRLPAGKAPLWVTPGDVNGDGRADALVVDLSSASFTVFLGKGDGTFDAGREIGTIRSPVVLQLADLDLDGDLDAALNGEGPDQAVAVHLGDGKGGFGPPALLPLSAGSGQGLAIADLNADGLPDLIAACAFSSPARVFLGAGGGAFLPERLFPGGTKNVFNVAALDLNRDGLPDLALSEGSDEKISILLNTTTPTPR